jgi:predicted transcriptional regulator
MRRSEAQKMIRKSNIQSDVFSILWGRRSNKDKSIRLRDIAEKIGKGADAVSGALKVLIELDIAVQVSRGVYKVSDYVEK